MNRRLLVATAAILAISLSGCSESGGDLALDYCTDLVSKNVLGDKLDTSELTAESVSNALYESGATSERDHSTTHYAVSGNVTTWEGSVESRTTVICQVIVADGRVTRLVDFTTT